MKTINGTRTTGCARKSTLGTTSICVAAGRPRSALLAGASLVALLAPAAHDVARAQCVGAPQIISTAVAGPIFGNDGPITVTGAGSVAGGPNGVDATTCSINTLATQAGGTITGGAGATGPNGGAGGAGVFSANTITTLTNGGAISGGNGGFSSEFLLGGAGGAGVSIVQGATVGWFANEATGMISGGGGGRRPGRRRRHRRGERRDRHDAHEQRRDQRRDRRPQQLHGWRGSRRRIERSGQSIRSRMQMAQRSAAARPPIRPKG